MMYQFVFYFYLYIYSFYSSTFHQVCRFTIKMADTADNVKRVAIIGAGLSGLLSLYHLKTSRTKIKLTAFEKNFNIGGTWLYTDQTKPNDFGLPVYTGVYKYLRFVGFLWCFCASFIFLILEKLDISITLVLLIEACNISNIFLTSQFRHSSFTKSASYSRFCAWASPEKTQKVLLNLIQITCWHTIYMYIYAQIHYIYIKYIYKKTIIKH